MLILPGFLPVFASLCIGDERVTALDFSSSTNPLISMEWTDANGGVHSSASNYIPVGANTTAGAFPGGNVRFRNVASKNGVLFDLVVTVVNSFIDETVEVSYTAPVSVPQAVLATSGGYACIGDRPALVVLSLRKHNVTPPTAANVHM